MQDSQCSLCPLGTTAVFKPKNVCLMLPTTTQCDVMIVAEQPSEKEDTYGEVFLGILGRIQKYFEAEGIHVHTTYGVKCARMRKDQKLSDGNIKICREAYLRKEIEEVKPKHIIVLGSGALYAVTKQKGLLSKRGAPILDPKVPYTVYATLHHAQALYSEENKVQMWDDLRLFAKWIKYGVEEAAQFDPPVIVADTIKALRTLQKRLRKAGGVAAVDVETQGLNAFATDKHVRCIQFCWDTNIGGVFVPLFMEPEAYYTRRCDKAVFWRNWDELKEAVKIIREILLETKCIWHNGKFDRIWLHQWGKRNFGAPILCPHILMDTMHVAFMLNEVRSVALKKLLTSEFGIPSYDIPDKMTMNMDLLIPYSTRDTVATLMLAQKYSAALKEPGMEKLRRLYFKVVRKADALYTKMEIEGWPVSLHKAEKIFDILAADIRKAIDKMHKIMADAGLPACDTKVFASTQKLVPVIFEQFHFHPNPDNSLAYTETGALSTGSDALLHLRGQPFIDALFDYRALTKALSTYVGPMRDAARERGKLTTSYKLARAVTGRTASGKEGKGKTAVGMNLQNICPDYEIKTIITPEDPDWWILECDFSQIELRVAGELANDATMKRVYYDGYAGGDLHTYRAQRVLGVTPEEWDQLDPKKKKKARSTAKPVNFGFLYGMSWHKFRQFAASQYGIEFTSQESKEHREDFFEAHRGLPKWYLRQEAQGKRLGYVESLSGRRRHLYNLKLNPESGRDARSKYQDAVRQAINTPVQGFASDLKIMALIEIDEMLDERYAKIIGEVHDSILMCVHKSHILEVAEKVLKIMRKPRLLEELGIEFHMPIEAEAECGPSWGEKREVSEWGDELVA